MSQSTSEFLIKNAETLREKDGKKFVTITKDGKEPVISGQGWTLTVTDNWGEGHDLKRGTLVFVEDGKIISTEMATSGGPKARVGSGCNAKNTLY